MSENIIHTDRARQTYRIISEHYAKYPKMQITDYFKLLFHSAFGCEHAVSSIDTAHLYIVRESESGVMDDGVLTETLDGAYGRVYLSSLESGLSAETLARIFCLSAKKEENGKEALEEKLRVLRHAVTKGLIPLSVTELDEAIGEWKAYGYPAVRHSDIYRETYNPKYRVVANKYIDALQIFIDIDTALSKGEFLSADDICLRLGKYDMREILLEVYGDRFQ